MKKVPFLASLAILMGLLTSTVNAIEEPAYEVLQSWDGKNIQVRLYAPRVLARTAMTEGENSGFRVLAAYIFGGNETEQEIAMTAPVQRSMAESPNPNMAFVMPSEFTIESLPAPNDERVQFSEEPAYHAAVIRFTGRATDVRVEEHWLTLSAFLESESIETTGQPTLNQYNPPWTLPFMRRNEIIVPVAKQRSDRTSRAATKNDL